MAAKKKSRSKRPSSAESSPTPSSPPAETQEPDRRDLRPFIYAGLDGVAVVAWAILLLGVLPNRHGWAAAFLWAMVGLGALMGGAMLVRNRWGWRVAAAACGALIVMWLVLIVILLMTAGFLAGVYGGFGQAAALGVIGIAFLSLQIIALLPAFQLKFLMTRAGRRHFSLEPLWS